jgi:hypothetical protein
MMLAKNRAFLKKNMYKNFVWTHCILARKQRFCLSRTTNISDNFSEIQYLKVPIRMEMQKKVLCTFLFLLRKIFLSKTMKKNVGRCL